MASEDGGLKLRSTSLDALTPSPPTDTRLASLTAMSPESSARATGRRYRRTVVESPLVIG